MWRCDHRGVIRGVDLSCELVGRGSVSPLKKPQVRILWYIAQTAFIGWFLFGVWERNPTMTAGQIGIQFMVATVLCAFLTACLTRLWDWTVRRLRCNNRKAGSESLRLVGTGRSGGKTAEHRKRIGVRK